MVSPNDRWARLFDIPETRRHKKGYTIYNVISMLYPEACPDAVTKLSVWKRYNDFKKLRRHFVKTFGSDVFVPKLPKTSFFKRFDADTIEKRRLGLIGFLQCVANDTKLFTALEFVKFFETSRQTDDVDETGDTGAAGDLSDSNSVATGGGVSITSTMESLSLLDESDIGSLTEQYILDAMVHVELASELEQVKDYQGAFAAYKTAIDIFLRFGPDDKDFERKQWVKYKTDKCLIKADKLFNMHLDEEIQDVRKICETHYETPLMVQTPINELYKYKVVRLIGSGMLAFHADDKPPPTYYYVKAVQKTNHYTNEHLILPENVPYMVRLHNYYDCDNCIVLIVDYCSGIRLSTYLKQSSHLNDSIVPPNTVLNASTPVDVEDLAKLTASTENTQKPGDDQTYSDLVNQYRFSKRPLSIRSSTSLDSFEIIDSDDLVGFSFNDTIKGTDECDGDSGAELPFEIEGPKIPVDLAVRWASQLVCALEKLHGLGVICGHLNTDHVLVDELTGDMVLTYRCVINEDQMAGGAEVGKRAKWWACLAPELCIAHHCPASEACDWWAFGTILYELLVGVQFAEVYPWGFHLYAQPLKIPRFVTPDGRSLLRQLLVVDPELRLGTNGINRIKIHPFFSSVRWNNLRCY